MSDTDIAWAAGLFEGEGSWHLRRSLGDQHRSVHLAASVVMADEDIVRRFAAVVDCGVVRVVKRKLKPHHKTQWQWYLNGAPVIGLFEMFEPWLGERRRSRFAELLAARQQYEREVLPLRYAGRKYLDRPKDPTTGRFLPAQGRLP